MAQADNYACLNEFLTPSKRCRKVSDKKFERNPEWLEGRKRYATQRECLQGCTGFPEDEAEEKGELLIPTDTYHFDPQRVNKYLDAFCDKTALSRAQKLAAQAIISETEIISFKTFKEKLRIALGRFARVFPEIGSLKWEPKPKIEMHKSNAWVLFLCLQMMPILRKGLVMTSSSPYNSSRENKGEKENKSEKPEMYIFFDDAMYTGSQMEENIQETMAQSGIKSFLNEDAPDIVIISAYSTKEARKRLRKKFHDQIAGFYIFSGADLLPIGDKLLNKYLDTASSLRTSFGDKRYAYIFQHKMPDRVSSFPEVYSGYIPPISRKQFQDFRLSNAPGASEFSQFDQLHEVLESKCPQRLEPQLIPYLSGCIETFEKSLAGEAARTFVESPQQCPDPPYKRIFRKEVSQVVEEDEDEDEIEYQEEEGEEDED